MIRTLIATLVAASFAAPAGAAPANLVEEMIYGAFAALGEPIVIERDLVIAAADDARIQAEAMRRWSEDFSHDLSTSLTTLYGPRFASSRLVKGAPYSAEVVTETNQSLADGNVITHKTAGAIYRDGEGRTRQESAGSGKKKPAVYINDPVAGSYTVLMPDSKTAIVRPRAKPMVHHEHVTNKDRKVMKVGVNEIRIEDGKVYLDGKDVTNGKVEIKGNKNILIENGRVTVDGKEITGASSKVIVRTLDEKETGDGTRREEIRVQVVRSGDREIMIPLPPNPPVAPVPPVPPLPPMPGVQTLRFESTAKLGKGVTTQLGAKDFDGVRAEGKSTVWTIPAGEIGNRNPIQVTSESWYSPDLKVTVYSRYHDPRTGESIYRLANIRRAEPARELFTVPEGYEKKGRAGRDERKQPT